MLGTNCVVSIMSDSRWFRLIALQGPTQFSVNVYIAAPGANTECIHFEDLPPTITASCLHRRVQRRTGLSETTLRFETDMENADEVLKRVYPPGTLEDVYMVRTIETRVSDCLSLSEVVVPT